MLDNNEGSKYIRKWALLRVYSEKPPSDNGNNFNSIIFYLFNGVLSLYHKEILNCSTF